MHQAHCRLQKRATPTPRSPARKDMIPKIIKREKHAPSVCFRQGEQRPRELAQQGATSVGSWVAQERLPGHGPASHQGSTAEPLGEALPAAAHGLLHSSGGHGRRRAGHGDASERVDDGDGVAAAGGSGLVEF